MQTQKNNYKLYNGLNDIYKPILIITFDMVPYSQQWGSCQRMYYLAEHLQKHNLDVILIHEKRDFVGYFGKVISFYPIPLCTNLLNKKNDPSSLLNKKNDPSSTVNRAEVKNNIFLKVLKCVAGITETFVYNEINPFSGLRGERFIQSSKNKIANIIQQNDIRIVIISGPPFSLFKLVTILRHISYDLKIIIDYRDPWNLWNNGNWLTRYKERKYLQLVDRVVFLNDRLMDDTAEKFGLDKQKCRAIYNGYSETDWNNLLANYKRCAYKANRLTISYIGGISFEKGSYRDMSIFWSAFEKFEHKDDIKIRFVGVDPSKETMELKRRFNASVEFIPRVDHEESLRYMLDSDILLLFHTANESAKYILTGKFFDYIRSGKIILGIAANEDTYFLDMIRTYKLGVATINSTNDILKSLDFIHCKWCEGKINELRKDERFKFDEFSREFQNNIYMKLIYDLQMDSGK